MPRRNRALLPLFCASVKDRCASAATWALRGCKASATHRHLPSLAACEAFHFCAKVASDFHSDKPDGDTSDRPGGARRTRSRCVLSTPNTRNKRACRQRGLPSKQLEQGCPQYERLQRRPSGPVACHECGWIACFRSACVCFSYKYPTTLVNVGRFPLSVPRALQ